MKYPEFGAIAGAKEVNAVVAMEVLNGRRIYDQHTEGDWTVYFLIDQRFPPGDISTFSVLAYNRTGFGYQFNASGSYEADFKYNAVKNLFKKPLR